MQFDRPIPLAIFVSSFDSGGTERQMSELMVRLDPARFLVHAVCFQRRGACLPAVAARAASVVEFPTHGFHRPHAWRQLLRFARWCRTHHIAIVHTCDFYANVFGLPGAALAAVPVRIGSRRELNPDKSAAKIATQRASYLAAHRIVANSTAAAARLAVERVPRSRVRVISNGLAVERFAPAVRPHGRRVITVANLRTEKGHELLIEAAAPLRTAYPQIEFIVVGDGPRRRELMDLARARGVGDAFSFLGHREDVAALLASADLFVLPSRSEALPNSVLEAMAAGLPVVATRVGGLIELIEHGRTGILIPPDDVKALAGAVGALLENPPHAAALGRAARAAVEARFSFDRMVAAFEDLYLSELRLRSRSFRHLDDQKAPAMSVR